MQHDPERVRKHGQGEKRDPRLRQEAPRGGQTLLEPGQEDAGLRQVHLVRLQENCADARNRLDAASAMAVSGLRTLGLIEGGAIVALFTLIGQGASSPFVKSANPLDILFAFASFALAIVLTLSATIIGFYSRQLTALYHQEVADVTYCLLIGRDEEWPPWSGAPLRLLAITVGLTVASVISFVIGACAALLASISSFGHEPPPNHSNVAGVINFVLPAREMTLPAQGEAIWTQPWHTQAMGGVSIRPAE